MHKNLFIKADKGFALVELIVVLVVISILTAIALPIYRDISDNSKLNAHLANIQTIEEAVQVFKAENKGVDLTRLDVDEGGTGFLVPEYIQRWPTKPGKYSVIDGVVIADPTRNNVLEAIKGESATVLWP